MPNTKKYYVIDDDADDRQFLIEALTDNNANVQCISVTNGVDAIDNLKKELCRLPDAIFLDQNMPGLSGQQCLVELKQIPSLQHIPVIIYSTTIDQKEIRKAMHLGAFHFLIKSSSYTELKKELMMITTRLDQIRFFPTGTLKQ